MKKVLPIDFNTPIKTECWTLFRTAIISAYPDLTGWFINHLDNIYINDSFEVNYGEYEGKYQTLQHYESVLNTYNRSLHNLTSENIIEYLIEQLDNDRYIIIEADSSKIYDYVNETYITESIIYGYDTDNEIFYSQTNFSFNDFKEAFKVRKEANYSDKEKTFIYRQCWYPITLLEVRGDYHAEPNLALFFNRLVMHGRRRHFDIIHDTEEYTSTFREGICSVYDGFLNMLNKIKEGTFDVTKMYHSFPYNYNKLGEFNTMFKWRLQILDKHYNLFLDDKIYETIDEVIYKLEICKNLATKYLENKDNNIITKIYGYSDEVLQTEEKIIGRLMDRIMKNILYRETHYNA